MTQPGVSQLTVYPIKSTAPLHQSRTYVAPRGLAFDRRYVVADMDGRFMTGRNDPALVTIQATPVAQGLLLSAPGMASLLVAQDAHSTERRPLTIWGDQMSARHCGEQYDQWLSEVLGKPCQLLHCDDQVVRITEHTEDHPVSFADGYPLLLISQASLDELNSRLVTPVAMAQFRPNIVVSNTTAFAEDSWKRIRIGTVEFAVAKPCSRCVFTTLNPQNAAFDPQREPLKTLAGYRRGEDQFGSKGVFFGQNLIALNDGIICLDDPVEVLEQQLPQMTLVS